MKILKNIKKIKLGIYFLIFGFIITIFFLILLILNHLNHLKANTVFQNFTKNRSYSSCLFK